MSIQSLFLYHHDCSTVYWLFISGHTPEHINCSFSISWFDKSRLWLHLSHLVALCNFRLLPLNAHSYKVQSDPYSRIYKVHNVQCDGHFVHSHCSLFWSDWSATFCLSTCIIFSFKPGYTLIFCITLDKVLTEGSLNTSWSILICPWTRM